MTPHPTHQQEIDTEPVRESARAPASRPKTVPGRPDQPGGRSSLLTGPGTIIQPFGRGDSGPESRSWTYSSGAVPLQAWHLWDVLASTFSMPRCRFCGPIRPTHCLCVVEDYRRNSRQDVFEARADPAHPGNARTSLEIPSPIRDGYLLFHASERIRKRPPIRSVRFDREASPPSICGIPLRSNRLRVMPALGCGILAR